jgi:hypothetical protein
MLFFAVWLKWLLGARLIYRITDFYPEVVIAALAKPNSLLRLLAQMTWWLRRQIDAFEALGNDQRRLLTAGGIATGRITVVRDQSPIEVLGSEAPAPRPPELADRVVLLYSGNFGVAHDAETLTQGFAAYCRGGGRAVGLWLNATGPGADAVGEALARDGLPFARTAPVPLDQLPSILVSADAHVICLKPEFAGLVLPSKVFGCLASRRPILFVGPEASDVHELCTSDNSIWYRRIEPGDVSSFADALNALVEHTRGYRVVSNPASAV